MRGLDQGWNDPFYRQWSLLFWMSRFPLLYHKKTSSTG